MQPLIRAVAALVVLCTEATGQPAGRGFDYVSPLPGSAMVSRLTNIILVPSRGIDSRAFMSSSSVIVRGDKSGKVSGAYTLSDDARTLIFTPAGPFADGEHVTVEVTANETAPEAPPGLPFTFSFRVSARPGLARRVADDPGPVIQQSGPYPLSRSVPGSVPADFPQVTLTASNNPSPGYLFLSNMTMGSGAPNTPYIMILDNAGNPVFYRRTLNECTDFKLQPNGLMTYDDSQNNCFLALDSTFAVVDTFRCGNGYGTNWHELRILPNGHALILGDDPQMVEMDSIVQGGAPSALVQGIVIQELDRSKNVVFQWRTFDHYKITDATHESLVASFIDPVHGNAIELDTDGNLLFSARHMDEITKINRQTGEIIWRWGGKNNQFTFVNDTLHFLHQHAIRRLPNGNVSLFDNGDFRLPLLSRGVEYALDEQNMKATLVWQFQRTPVIYAPAMGYVQRLSNGNSIIGWGAVNPTMTEVHSDGSVALELTFPPGIYSYRSYKFVWKPAAAASITPPSAPLSFSLNQNYPNPFNPSTVINFSIAGSGDVRLEVFDVLGRLVTTLVNREMTAGSYRVVWEGNDRDGAKVSSGIYVYRIASGAFTASRKMLLLR